MDIRLTSFILGCAFAAVSASAVTYYPIDLEPQANTTLASSSFINGNTIPSGDTTLAGVPFMNIFPEGKYWNASQATGPNPVILEVPVNVFGVTEVHSLINTYWGAFGPDSFAAVEFFGSDGSTYHVDLVGGVDIRDYNQNPAFPATINGTTTVEAFNNGLGQRLDKQVIALPATFADETLLNVKFIDNGRNDFQRIFVGGLTVAAADESTVPEGGLTLALFGISLAGLAAVTLPKAAHQTTSSR